MHRSVSFTFGAQQPPAIITSFAPLSVNAGDTITGSVFDGLTAFYFDTTRATIIGTPTTTQIQVKLPAGIAQAFVYVKIPGGVAKSVASFGFKYVIFAEPLTVGWGPNNGCGYDGYNSTCDY